MLYYIIPIIALALAGCNSLTVAVETDPDSGVTRKNIRAVSFHLNPLRDAELADFEYLTPAEGGREIRLGSLRQQGAGQVLQELGASAIRARRGGGESRNLEALEVRLEALEAGGSE